MNCKHVKVEGNTTKYYWCKLFDKAVDDYTCRDCMMKIPALPEGFDELFKSFKRR